MLYFVVITMATLPLLSTEASKINTIWLFHVVALNYVLMHHVSLKQWAFGAMSVCFWDDGLLDKWSFSPVGHFSDYWCFRVMGRCNNGFQLIISSVVFSSNSELESNAKGYFLKCWIISSKSVFPYCVTILHTSRYHICYGESWRNWYKIKHSISTVFLFDETVHQWDYIWKNIGNNLPISPLFTAAWISLKCYCEKSL